MCAGREATREVATRVLARASKGGRESANEESLDGISAQPKNENRVHGPWLLVPNSPSASTDDIIYCIRWRL